MDEQSHSLVGVVDTKWVFVLSWVVIIIHQSNIEASIKNQMLNFILCHLVFKHGDVWKLSHLMMVIPDEKIISIIVIFHVWLIKNFVDFLFNINVTFLLTILLYNTLKVPHMGFICDEVGDILLETILKDNFQFLKGFVHEFA